MNDGPLLLDHHYGKQAIRLVHVARNGERHELLDLDVDISLTGELADCYLHGDNRNILPTDSQKNTVYALAKETGIGRIEDFALLLARHFVRTAAAVTQARVEIREHRWDRLTPSHSFLRADSEVRTATVVHDEHQTLLAGGLRGLDVLKSGGSEFRGFLKDEYTTLPESADRIMATTVTASWRYTDTAEDWNGYHSRIRRALLDGFARIHSRSLQETLYTMGRKALEVCPSMAEIRLSLPNRHHVSIDLTPFGLDNDNEVFAAVEQPHGLIEGTLLRQGAGTVDLAWW